MVMVALVTRMVFKMERSGQICGWSQENLPMGGIWKVRGRQESRENGDDISE